MLLRKEKFIQGIEYKKLFKIPVRATKHVWFSYDHQSSIHCKILVHITKTTKRLIFYYVYLADKTEKMNIKWTD